MATVVIQCDQCGNEWDTEATGARHSSAVINARQAGWKCDDWDVMHRHDYCPDCYYTCPVCKKTSYNPNDIKHHYCGNCHKFEGQP